MSIASKLLTLNGLYQRIQTKLRNLGLMSVSDTGLSDCTDAIEDIDEVTPYMMTQAGIQNVAGYKYAQIDQTAWVPAGSTPSGLVSVVTGLSAAGIVDGHPRNPVVVGTVYPPSGYQGIYANQIELDGDVIKAENIKSGVSILGVNGSYNAGSDAVFQSTSVTVSEVTFPTAGVVDSMQKISKLFLMVGDSTNIVSDEIMAMYMTDNNYTGDWTTIRCYVITDDGLISTKNVHYNFDLNGDLVIQNPFSQTYTFRTYSGSRYSLYITHTN